MNWFTVACIDDIDRIPHNVTKLVWIINDSIDILQNFNNLTHISFWRFYDIPFRIPPNIQEITIICENSKLFTPLYINYSEYLVQGTKSIKVGNNTMECILNKSDYVEKIKFLNNMDIIKEVSIEETTYEEIEDFLSAGMNLKPAKNK